MDRDDDMSNEKKLTKKNVAIAFGITKDYTFALANVLIGMKKHCIQFWDDIIVYHDGISDKDQAAINSILPCTYIYFDETLFNDEAIHSEALKGYSLLTLARFECFGLLEQYHKVIWHDVDILVQKDFSGLLEYGDVSGYAATQSPTFRVEQNFYGLMPGYNMLSLLYNAGILVLSNKLKEPAELRVYCYNTFNQYAPKLRYNDQSVLNMMIQDYNIQVEKIDLDYYCCHPDTPNYKEASIIHAYGSNKFWNSTKLENQFPEWHENNKKWLDTKKQFNKKRTAIPEVTVLMSVYERTEYIQESVKSILNQTFDDFEFIIVVEKSPVQQQICAELEAFNDSRIVVLANEEKLGFPASLNVGLDRAKGKYIARMDDDDISRPDRLEKEVRYLDTHPDISVVGSWIQIFGRESREERRPETHEELKVWAIKENPMFHPTVLMRKADLDQYAFRYDPECLTEDYDLWMRMMEKCKFANIPEVLHDFRASVKNATVTKAEKVAVCHLNIMRRTLRTSLGLEFSNDEMLLLRQPSIINECYNSNDFIELRKRVIQQIFDANAEKNVYETNLLEKYFEKPELDLKVEVKSQLKNYPWLYERIRKIYRRIIKKEEQNTGEKKASLLCRIKMRLLPPSSKSFHARLDELEKRLDSMTAQLQHQINVSLMNEKRIMWCDEIVRRGLLENGAGFLGIYTILGEDCQDVSWDDEDTRLEFYRRYISARHIMKKVIDTIEISDISVDNNATDASWRLAGGQMKMSGDSAGLSVIVAPDMGRAEDGNNINSIKGMCEVNKAILFTLEKNLGKNRTEVEQELELWKAKFSNKSYQYLDLRPYIENDWEVLPEYKESLCLFVPEDYWYSVLESIKQAENK